MSNRRKVLAPLPKPLYHDHLSLASVIPLANQPNRLGKQSTPRQVPSLVVLPFVRQSCLYAIVDKPTIQTSQHRQKTNHPVNIDRPSISIKAFIGRFVMLPRASMHAKCEGACQSCVRTSAGPDGENAILQIEHQGMVQKWAEIHWRTGTGHFAPPAICRETIHRNASTLNAANCPITTVHHDRRTRWGFTCQAGLC